MLGRHAVLALAVLATGPACGASAPPDEVIYHDPALRPGVVPPTSEEERQLLSRLDELSSGEPVTLGGERFVAEPPYDAASGRRCRRIERADGDSAKLACSQQDGEWVFVPNPFLEEPPR